MVSMIMNYFFQANNFYMIDLRKANINNESVWDAQDRRQDRY